MKKRPVQRATPRIEEVEISGIAAGGEGVGRLADGRVVFVHRTAPGDRVEARIDRERASWARGSLLRLVRSSADRRPPPCRHYHDCGGCTLEHLTYPAQLAAKGAIVRDALARIAGVSVSLPVVVASPREHRYRNRVSFALRRLGDGRVIAGFHALGDPARIVPIDGDCLLPEEPIATAWDELRDTWGPNANRLPAGERLRLTLRSTAHGRVALLVEGGSGEGRLDELIGRVAALDSVWHQPSPGTARLIAGAPGLPETWGDDAFDLAGAAFLQINRGAAALLEQHVL
ncbi:MAG TPA: TRAM domain-containing protein, partial [Longimicrobiaceae bacterium]|nr:TRAM domain-containing protein [Longimicrobiaceae bacterium]